MKIKTASISDFDFIFSEITKNFIPDEHRDYKEALALFKSEKYKILCFVRDGEDVGFITVWPLSEFIFAEHFVIYEQFRNKGYGAEALGALKAMFPKIVLEAEPPFAELQLRRLNFYKRNGFLENPEKYVQPAFRKGGNEVPLVIMSFPTTLSDFENTVSIIKKEVYFKK